MATSTKRTNSITFSTKEVEIKWKNEWGGQMFYSHGSNHSKGVAILIKPNQLNIELKRTIHDKSGRFLIMEARIEQTVQHSQTFTHQMIIQIKLTFLKTCRKD